MLENLIPITGQTLSVANGADTFSIASIILDENDVVAGDFLSDGATLLPIATVDASAGTGTLEFNWTGTSRSGYATWFIWRNPAVRQSAQYAASQASKVSARQATIMGQRPLWWALTETNTPWTDPEEGDQYLVGAAPTGAWASWAGLIVQRRNGADVPVQPGIGDGVNIVDALVTKIYDGSSWAAEGVAGDVILTSLNGGPLGGFRNLLINPMGRFNQRALASNADDTYGHDRWNVLTQTGTVAVSTLSDVENGLPSMMRMTQSQATAQRMGVSQIIESLNCKHLRGKAVTLSGRVRCSAAATLRYAILEWTGTADSVTSDVVNDWTSSTYTAGNFFLASNLTVTAVGSLALSANTLTDLAALTATLGSSMNNLIALIWTEGTVAQNVTMDYALQLEQGSVATPREVRPFTTELHLCQRYYCKSFTLSQAPAEGIGSNWYAGFAWTTVGIGVASILFPVQMRANPSLTFFKSNQAGGTDTHWQWYDGSNYQDSSVTALSGTLTVNGMSVNLTVTGATQGRAYIVQGNWVASVEL